MRQLAVIKLDELVASMEADFYDGIGLVPGTVRYMLHAIGIALLRTGVKLNLIGVWEDNHTIYVGALIALDSSDAMLRETAVNLASAVNDVRPAGVQYNTVVVRGESMEQFAIGGNSALTSG